jgi:VTC domain
MSSRAAVEAALVGFMPAPRDLVDGRQLLRRRDAKFVIATDRVVELVGGLAGAYAVLPVPGGAVATYRNLYFDTTDLRCFHDHRRGRRVRRKVRIRHYPDRALSYLELKTKRDALVTDKQRCAIAFGAERLGPREREFLRDHAAELADVLEPAVRIDYQRTCLIGIAHDERVTIDLELEAIAGDGRRCALGEVAIVEIKRPPHDPPHSPARRALARLGARERSLSKYCAAIAAIDPRVRHNRLRPSLRLLETRR